MKAHFVEFLSPGTFVSESTQKEIDSWDVEQAKEMARSIKERHNATPYGFRFITRERGDNDLNSKITETSGTYFLGGVVRHIDFVILENKPDEQTLIWNMKMNKIDRVITNTNSWKTTMEFRDNDVLLDWS
jgi:hypothetical protein